jgi:uncharacterized membrane protein
MKKPRRITKDDAFTGACVSVFGVVLFLIISAWDASIFPLIGIMGCFVAQQVFTFLFYR